ncbi:MAG: hypothetical protein V1915_03605 [Candidatus Bathyarchaeota archaeon]
MGKLAHTRNQRLEFLFLPFKVIVSPFRAFKEIAGTPDVKGVGVIAGLILLATAGVYYAYSAKIFLLSNGTSTSFLSSEMFVDFIASILVERALLFVENWILYGCVLFLVMRVFRQKEGSWRPFFTLVGYAFSITVVQTVISAVLFASFPAIQFSTLSSFPPATPEEAAIVTAGIQERWAQMPTYQALAFFNFPLINIFDVWFGSLSVIIIRAFSEVTWRKAGMIAVTAFSLRVFLKIVLGF